MADFSNSNVDSVYGRDLSQDPGDETIDVRFIVVGHKCKKNEQLREALMMLGMPVVYSDTGFEHMHEAQDEDTVFVMDKFDGDIFVKLHRAGARIVGPPVVMRAAQNGERLPHNSRPLYCTTMRHLILCFTGFKVKDDLARLADLVHHMGGSIRKDFSARVTHLVSNCCGGEKYRVAVSMGTPIMSEEWVHRCWEHRDDVNISANDDYLASFKMSPFSFATLSFLGFSKEEQRHMEELTIANGGTCAEPGAPTCTHLVVDEHAVRSIPFELHHRLHVVKSEWFWGSIQMDATADENMYRMEDLRIVKPRLSIEDLPLQFTQNCVPPSMTNEISEMFPGTPTTSRSGHTTPKTLSGSKSRKRKRLRENLAQLAAEGDMDSPYCMNKRRSNEIARMSFSASFLDATADTSSTPTTDLKDVENKTPPSANMNKMSAHQLTVMELLQTEKNYVGILHTILKIFKEEIEKVDQPGGPLLDPTNVKLIFGKIPPLYETHTKIRDELEDIVNNYSEQRSIGDVILNHADALLKAYPPFVNFFESTKETLSQCDKTKPRFHAFLKVCQSKPECGRQTLTELLIRPVQRLPSIMLLLRDILKRTDKNNTDHIALERAIETLEEVMQNINEDKRKADGHQQMFDIINDIDNCPPNLLSSHRKFVLKADVIELTETLSGRGDNISLFVFTDSLEMCKRRVKVLNAKSPATHGAKTPQKAYKHIELMQLSFIKRVVDINETKDCKNVFALVTKELNKKEKLYAFVLMDEEVDKEEFLRTLAKTICTSMCRTDFETLIGHVDKENLLAKSDNIDLQIDTSDLNNRTLSKAATKFGKRVSRAFSFNKTPRKLKRAMSSMSQVMSPFRRDSMTFLNPNIATPRSGTRSDLRGMRLASTNDLTPGELDEEEFRDASLYEMPEIPEQEGPGKPSPKKKRRETLSGFTYNTIRRQFSKRKKSTTWKEARKSLQPLSIKDHSSPITSLPSTPNLSSQLSKSVTIGHAAGMKLL